MAHTALQCSILSGHLPPIGLLLRPELWGFQGPRFGGQRPHVGGALDVEGKCPSTNIRGVWVSM